MLINKYIISDVKSYEKVRSTIIRKKTRLIARAYVIVDYSFDGVLKNFTFRRKIKSKGKFKVEDKLLYGYFDEDYKDDGTLELTIAIRNLLPKNYHNSIKLAFPHLHKFVAHKEEDDILVSLTSNEIYTWECDRGHVYDMRVSERVKRELTGDACVDCHSIQAKNKKLLKKYDLKKNNLPPSQVRITDTTNMWWTCERCGGSNHYTIDDVLNDKDVCKKCKASGSSMIERRIFFFISYVFGKDVRNNYRIPKRIGQKRVDIYIPDIKVAIEYDGVYWHKNKENKDRKKTELLEKNDISLIRIREKGLSKIRNTDITYNFNNKKDFSVLMKKVFDCIDGVVPLSDDQKKKLREIANENFKESLVPKDFFYYPLKKNSLAKMYKAIAKQWSPNNPISPLQVSSQSNYMALWICYDCGHEIKQSVSSRVNSKNKHCPKCAIKGESFQDVYPQLAKFWSPNNKMSPGVVKATRSRTNNSLYKFNCYKCSTEFESSITKVRAIEHVICPSCYKGLSDKYGLPVWSSKNNRFEKRSDSFEIKRRHREETALSVNRLKEFLDAHKENNIDIINLTKDMIDKDNTVKYLVNGKEYFDLSTIDAIFKLDAKSNIYRIVKKIPIQTIMYKNTVLYPVEVIELIDEYIDGKSKYIKSNKDSSSISGKKDILFIKKDVVDIRRNVLRVDFEIADYMEYREEKSKEETIRYINKIREQLDTLEEKVQDSSYKTPYSKTKKRTKEYGEPKYPKGTINSGRWSDFDLNWLKENYTTKSNKELAKILCRTEDSIGKKGRELGLHKDFFKKSIKKYTNRKFDLLSTPSKAKNTPVIMKSSVKVKTTKKEPIKSIKKSKNLKKNITPKDKVNSIIKKVNKSYVPNYPEGTVNYGRWTIDDEYFLIKNYSKHGRKYCEKKLCRNGSSVQKKINALGLSRRSKKKSSNKNLVQTKLDL